MIIENQTSEDRRDSMSENEQSMSEHVFA